MRHTLSMLVIALAFHVSAVGGQAQAPATSAEKKQGPPAKKAASGDQKAVPASSPLPTGPVDLSGAGGPVRKPVLPPGAVPVDPSTIFKGGPGGLTKPIPVPPNTVQSVPVPAGTVREIPVPAGIVKRIDVADIPKTAKPVGTEAGAAPVLPPLSRPTIQPDAPGSASTLPPSAAAPASSMRTSVVLPVAVGAVLLLGGVVLIRRRRGSQQPATGNRESNNRQSTVSRRQSKA